MNATISAVRTHANDLFEISKPRIALLVLLTTFAGMWLASGGYVSLDLVVYTLMGTGLASASSGALNNYVDREVDKLMARTRNRALPTSRLHPQQALWLGGLLSISSFTILFYLVNPLTAYLALGTTFFYVVIYTIWLKRTTPLCTEVGGIAGALPPVIGWAAVTNNISWQAMVMFLIMFIWQPPHFWALALLRVDEYRRANLPMLPVVSGMEVTKFRMLLYTIVLIPVSTTMYWFNLAGLIYLTAALVLGIIYLVITIDFARKPITHKSTKRLFGYSIIYLCGLFVFIFADCQCSGIL